MMVVRWCRAFSDKDKHGSIRYVWQILWKVTQFDKGVVMVAGQSSGADDIVPLRGLLTGQHHPHYHPHPSIY